MSSDAATAGLSKGDEIIAVLQRDILLGTRPVNSWLRHDALAEEFGTSRTPVREALRVLHAQGIVTIVPNRGAQVNGHSSRDVRELGEIRAELEGFAAERAAHVISDKQLRLLQKAWQDYDPDDEQDQWVQHWTAANQAFHTIIVESSGNSQVAVALDAIHRKLPPNISYAAYRGNSRLARKNFEEHAGIAKAISDGDAALARKLTTAHILSSVDATVRWAESQGMFRTQDEEPELDSAR
jgi:DNA-binding GntR family transcriptional regulator